MKNIHSSKILIPEKQKEYGEGFYFTINTKIYSATNVIGYSGIAPNTYKSLVNTTVTIDWGDGTKTSVSNGVFDDTNNKHNYKNPGKYQIRITSTGDFPTINIYRSFGSYRKTVISIDTPLPKCYDKYGNPVKDLSYFCYYCENLASIPEHLFDNNTELTDLSIAFENTSISKIPKDLFKYNTKVNDVRGLFEDCSKIREIPPDLFRYMPEITDFNYVFSGCRSLKSVPKDIFRYNINATGFYDAFYSCHDLISVPTDIFKYNTKATGFGRTFCGCSSLETNHEDIFRDSFYKTGKSTNLKMSVIFSGVKSTETLSHEYVKMYYETLNTFYEMCSSWNLKYVPEDIFNEYTEVTSFAECFDGSDLITLPENLFRYNTKVKSFEKCFYSCYDLETIPENLFRYNTQAENFSNTFSSTSELKSIPENLFKYNTLAKDFTRCFYRSGFSEIPANLFKYNTEVETFEECFYEAKNYTSIPSGLFDNCKKVKNFNCCFACGNKLVSVPNDLFKNNIEVTDFSYCFYGSYNLAEIPDNIFKYNINVTDFSHCFYQCDKLKINPNIFGVDYKNRFIKQASLNFSNAFERNKFTGVIGTAPALWSFTFKNANNQVITPTTTGCFSGNGNNASSISNYSAIPSKWL